MSKPGYFTDKKFGDPNFRKPVQKAPAKPAPASRQNDPTQTFLNQIGVAPKGQGAGVLKPGARNVPAPIPARVIPINRETRNKIKQSGNEGAYQDSLASPFVTPQQSQEYYAKGPATKKIKVIDPIFGHTLKNDGYTSDPTMEDAQFLMEEHYRNLAEAADKNLKFSIFDFNKGLRFSRPGSEALIPSKDGKTQIPISAAIDQVANAFKVSRDRILTSKDPIHQFLNSMNMSTSGPAWDRIKGESMDEGIGKLDKDTQSVTNFQRAMFEDFPGQVTDSDFQTYMRSAAAVVNPFNAPRMMSGQSRADAPAWVRMTESAGNFGFQMALPGTRAVAGAGMAARAAATIGKAVAYDLPQIQVMIKDAGGAIPAFTGLVDSVKKPFQSENSTPEEFFDAAMSAMMLFGLAHGVKAGTGKAVSWAKLAMTPEKLFATLKRVGEGVQTEFNGTDRKLVNETALRLQNESLAGNASEIYSDPKIAKSAASIIVYAIKRDYTMHGGDTVATRLQDKLRMSHEIEGGANFKAPTVPENPVRGTEAPIDSSAPQKEFWQMPIGEFMATDYAKSLDNPNTAVVHWQLAVKDAYKAGKEIPKDVLQNYPNLAPHLLTKAEYDRANYLGYTNDMRQRGHKFWLEKALSEGKEVPDHVLADYPDLKINEKIQTPQIETPPKDRATPKVKTDPVAKPVEDKVYTYRLTSRPAGNSTTPDVPGRTIVPGTNTLSNAGIMDYGSVSYTRPLTGAEIHDFSLVPDIKGVSTPTIRKMAGATWTVNATHAENMANGNWDKATIDDIRTRLSQFDALKEKMSRGERLSDVEQSTYRKLWEGFDKGDSALIEDYRQALNAVEPKANEKIQTPQIETAPKAKADKVSPVSEGSQAVAAQEAGVVTLPKEAQVAPVKAPVATKPRLTKDELNALPRQEQLKYQPNDGKVIGYDIHADGEQRPFTVKSKADADNAIAEYKAKGIKATVKRRYEPYYTLREGGASKPDLENFGTSNIADLYTAPGTDNSPKATPKNPKPVTKAEPPKAPAKKEPWEMTVKEFADKPAFETTRERSIINHQKEVKQALAEGKPVPADVLKDYPDLAPKKVESKPVETPEQSADPIIREAHKADDVTWDKATEAEYKKGPKKAGLTAKQREFLIGKLRDNFGHLPEKVETTYGKKKGIGGAEVNDPTLLKGFSVNGDASKGVEIAVPGDGTYTVHSQEQARGLAKAIGESFDPPKPIAQPKWLTAAGGSVKIMHGEDVSGNNHLAFKDEPKYDGSNQIYPNTPDADRSFNILSEKMGTDKPGSPEKSIVSALNDSMGKTKYVKVTFENGDTEYIQKIYADEIARRGLTLEQGQSSSLRVVDNSGELRGFLQPINKSAMSSKFEAPYIKPKPTGNRNGARKPLEQAQKANKPKGSYIWDEATQRGILTLNKNADASTVIHELQHHFLQTASGQTKANIASWALKQPTTPEQAEKIMAEGSKNPRYVRIQESFAYATEQSLKGKFTGPADIQEAMDAFRGYLGSVKEAFVPGEVSLNQKLEQANPQTKTKEFREWFGESKVVDEKGEPMVVYHGSEKGGYDQFRSGGGDAGKGIYFTSSPTDADFYHYTSRDGTKGTTYPVHVSIKNPLVVKNKFKLKELLGDKVSYDKYGYPDDAQMQAAVRAMGHDGIIIENPAGYPDIKHYVAFEPTQIKSAIANSGKFDPKNPSILHQNPKGKTKLTPHDSDFDKLMGEILGGEITADHSNAFEKEVGRAEPNPKQAKSAANESTQEGQNYSTQEEVAKLRERFGIKQYEKNPETVEGWFNESKAKGYHEPDNASDLAVALEVDGKTANNVETTGLAVALAKIDDQLKALAEGPNTPESFAKEDRLRAMGESIAATLDKSGSAWGREGVARKLLIKNDYSYAGLQRKAAKYGVEADVNKEKFLELSDIIETETAKLKGEDPAPTTRETADSVIKTAESDAIQTSRKKQSPEAKAKAKETSEARKAALIAHIRELTDSNELFQKDPAEMGVSESIKELAIMHVKDGARGLESVVKRVQDDLPHLDAQEIIDAIGERGEPKTLSELQKAIADLKREAVKASTEGKAAAEDRKLQAEKKKVESRVDTLNKQIADIEKQLAANKFPDPRKRTESTDPVIRNLEAKLKILRKAKREAIAKLPESVQKKTDARIKSINKQIEAYELKIKNKDFADPAKKPAPTDPAEIAAKARLSEAGKKFRLFKKEPWRAEADVESRFKIYTAKAEAHRILEKAKRKADLQEKDIVDKSLDITQNAIDKAQAVSGGMVSTFDDSGVFRQGGDAFWQILLSKNYKNALTPMKKGFKSMPSKMGEYAVADEYMQHPYYDESVADGVDYTGVMGKSHEEQVVGLHAIPKIGDKIAFSERAFSTTGNAYRFEVYKQLRDAISPKTAADRKLIAEFVNISTGRAVVNSRLAKIVLKLPGMWAPRWLMSRAQVLHVLRGNASWRVKRGVALSELKAIAGPLMVMGLLKTMGAKVTDDYDDPDFGKIVIGKLHIDMTAGRANLLRHVLQQISTAKKWTNNPNAPSWGKDSPAEELLTRAAHFYRIKLNPLAQSAANLGTGQDVLGNPYKSSITPFGRAVVEAFTPLGARLGYQESIEAREGKISSAELGVSVLLDIFGIGTQTYEPRVFNKDPNAKLSSAEIQSKADWNKQRKEREAFTSIPLLERTFSKS